MRRLATLAMVTLATFHLELGFAEELASSVSPPSGLRVTYFISDLHLGVGHVSRSVDGTWTSGDWHPMEDFRWHDEFNRFLLSLEDRVRSTGTPADLIILGDFLELWQTPSEDGDCIYTVEGRPISVAPENQQIDHNLSCSETDALKRAKRVVGAHKPIFEQLQRFSQLGDNRITIVPGNHDAALIYPSVANLILQAIGGADRVRIATEGYWRSADGLIFAEHGHFIKGDVNSYDQLPASCVNLTGTQVSCQSKTTPGPFLKRPWGEQFVQNYYNKFEERFPVIDNLPNEVDGIKLATAEVGMAESTSAVKDGLVFLLLHESLTQFAELLGPLSELQGTGQLLGGAKYESAWDIEAVKGQGPRFLVESLYPDDPLRPAAEKALREGLLDYVWEKAKGTNEDLVFLCNLREARREEQRNDRRPGPMIEPCLGKSTTLGAVSINLFTTAAERKALRLEQVRNSLPAEVGRQPEFSVYVYGHTHNAHAACMPRKSAGRISEKDSWNPSMINTGAWQRTATLDFVTTLMKKKGKQKFSNLRPEDLPACYTVVSIPAYQGSGKAPQPTLLYWRLKNNGDWGFASQCESDPTRTIKYPCMN